MFLCTLVKGRENLYWVDFYNWLCDGRSCAIAYLRTLLEYFRQSFDINEDEVGLNDDFISQILSFRRHSVPWETIQLKLDDPNIDVSKTLQVDLRLNGSIGDDGGNITEIDFANADIGYGISGTQEEILFASRPELCVAILFADTMRHNESIIMTGARKVCKLQGYGTNVKYDENSLIPFKFGKDCISQSVIAIDALPFDDELDEQLQENNLKREFTKAYAGFSSGSYTAIATGHWGCGAFGGDKELKSVIQFIAASLAESNKLIYYCFGDEKFYADYNKFLLLLSDFKIGIKLLWKMILELGQHKIDKQKGIFELLSARISDNSL